MFSTTSTHEKIWLDKSIYDLAEKRYYEMLAKPKENSSPTCKKQKIEAVNQESPKKCFVGFEKDGTGTYKAPEKVWVDKLVYDLAEKEYYEKLEKSRLVSNDKDVKVQVQEQIVTEVDTNVREKDGIVESIFDENDVKLVNISDILVDESTPTVDIALNEIKVKNTDEKTASELLNEFIADELPSSPIKSVKITKNEHDSTQTLSSELTDKEEHKTKSSPILTVDEQVINLQIIDEQIEKQVITPDKNIKISDDKHSQTERVDDLKESLLQETHESSKHQKVKADEQQFINDVVGIKRKASDEKKVQDSTVKLQKGAQNPHKKSNISPPKNKSTNVNTIPAFPKMTATTVNGGSLSLKINTGNDINKTNSPSTQTSQIDVKVIETVPVIKPRETLPNTTNIDETQTKKESKKNKKNKKRHRDEKGVTQNANTWNSLAGEVAKARQHIKNSLQCIDDIASITSNNVIVEVNNRINTLEMENTQMKQRVSELTDLLSKFEERLANMEKNSKPSETVTSRSVASGSSAKLPTQQDDDEDDGVDLFASDSEEENAEATKIKEQRLAEYAAKKSKKPAIIAKSSIVLDVKPWDDTTDMKLMEQEVRKIKTDGLLWGASKLVPLAYGIHKLQISCVVEDEKVSVDWLQETIETIEDYVQSVDIAAFNKI